MAQAVRLNSTGINAFLRSPAGPLAMGLLVRGRRVETRAKQLCPVDTGRLRSTITTGIVIGPRGVTVRIGTNVSYALAVHEGTGIYGKRHQPIRPVNASVLRFPARSVRSAGNGRTSKSQGATSYVYARQVRGVRGRPFLRDALLAATV